MNVRAFDGIKIVIFGRTSKLPMDLEQRIADAVPELESRIESFEDYNAALDHCKKHKDVGLFIALEDQSSPSVDEVVRNLAKPYEKSGWPACAVLIFDRVKSVHGQGLVSGAGRFMSYRGLEELSSITAVKDFMTVVAEEFVNRIEEILIPPLLQNTLIQGAEPFLPSGYALFHHQTLNILAPNLSLSWRAIFSLRWHPIIAAVKKSAPSFLEPHSALVKVISSIRAPSIVDQSAIEIQFDKDLPLESRLLAFLEELNEMRVTGNLQSYLARLSAESKPGSPALVRQVAKNGHLIANLISALREAG